MPICLIAVNAETGIEIWHFRGVRHDMGSRLPVTAGWSPRFLNPDGYPAIAPPWATLTAINLNPDE